MTSESRLREGVQRERSNHEKGLGVHGIVSGAVGVKKDVLKRKQFKERSQEVVVESPQKS